MYQYYINDYYKKNKTEQNRTYLEDKKKITQQDLTLVSTFTTLIHRTFSPGNPFSNHFQVVVYLCCACQTLANYNR